MLAGRGKTLLERDIPQARKTGEIYFDLGFY
jgi:hypothetical protein